MQGGGAVGMVLTAALIASEQFRLLEHMRLAADARWTGTAPHHTAPA